MPDERAGLFPAALCITHVEGPPAPPACPQPLQWLHCMAWKPGPAASPSFWCDLVQSLSLEQKSWAVTWKAPASSDIYYFRLPQPLTIFLPALLELVTGRSPPWWGPHRRLPSLGTCPVLSARPRQLPFAG